MGRDRDNTSTADPEEVREVLTNLTGHHHEIARGHPATKKCRMEGRQEIGRQRDRPFDEVAMGQCLSMWMPAAVANCAVLPGGDPAPAVVLKA